VTFQKAARALAELQSGAKTLADLDPASRAALDAEVRAIMLALERPGDTRMDVAVRFACSDKDWPEVPRRMWQALVDAGAPPRLD